MNHNDHRQASARMPVTKMSDIMGSHDVTAGTPLPCSDKIFLAESRSHNSRYLLVKRRSTLGLATQRLPSPAPVLPAILGTVVFVYGGLVFIRGHGPNLPITSRHDDAYQLGDHIALGTSARASIRSSRLTFGGKSHH